VRTHPSRRCQSDRDSAGQSGWPAAE
jgi:hypothetical protein